MEHLNSKLDVVNQKSEGFYPGLFEINYNFEGIGDLPKIMKAYTNEIDISKEIPNTFDMELGDKNIEIKFQIDTSSDEFKGLLKYFIELHQSVVSDSLLGTITIYNYGTDGKVFLKRIFHGIKYNRPVNTFDIFDYLNFNPAMPDVIHHLHINFTYEKLEYVV